MISVSELFKIILLPHNIFYGDFTSCSQLVDHSQPSSSASQIIKQNSVRFLFCYSRKLRRSCLIILLQIST